MYSSDSAQLSTRHCGSALITAASARWLIG
jgi:hypothetical protein